MMEEPAIAPCSSWSAERSALVADVLLRGGRLRQSVRLRVHGESMLPALWPGDVVEIASCSLEDVRPGEIVLARREGRFFMHRLVGRFNDTSTTNGFLLRGDSMPSPDLNSLPKRYWAGWCRRLTKALTKGDPPHPLGAQGFVRSFLA